MNAATIQEHDIIRFRRANERKYRVAYVELVHSGDVFHTGHKVAIVEVAGKGRQILNLTNDLKWSLVAAR
jgi:hypothetical protein